MYRPKPADLIRDPNAPAAEKPRTSRYNVILKDGQFTSSTLRLLKLLGSSDGVESLRLYTMELTATQAQRLREQPWVSSVEVEQIYHTCSTGVVRGKAAPPTYALYLKRKPSKFQGDLLYILGVEKAELDAGSKVYDGLDLTDTQVKILGAQKWVKNVSPSVQFQPCSPMPTQDDANYAKIDAALNGELNNRRDPDSVAIPAFIHTHAVPTPDQVAYLNSLGGVRGTSKKTTLFTANLSQNQVRELSLLGWIKSLRGSGTSRPA
jgi:hypothetical protein